MGQLSVLVMIAEEETDNLKMFCRGGENCCGKESNRLCDEGEERKFSLPFSPDFLTQLLRDYEILIPQARETVTMMTSVLGTWSAALITASPSQAASGTKAEFSSPEF